MIRIKAWFANWLWGKLCEPARRRYEQSLATPATAQAGVLQRILSRHAESAYGRKIDLRTTMEYSEFAQALPVVGYEDLLPWIERVKQGERDVLSCGKVLALERSSGSTFAAKFIPFTEDLRAEFQEAVRTWMGDLHRRYPQLAGGRAWWVVSQLPNAGAKTTGGIPIGLPNDDEYLGWWERKFASWLRVANTADLTVAARELLAAKDLRLISVWNPSYLALLWDKLHSPLSPQQLWPNLTIISGWAAASAAADAAAIQQLFPHATFQPKGLLATEGVVTIPWGSDSAGPLPALNSHFLEFQHCASREIYRVHELQSDTDYEVVLTTSGGLWRYRLHDIVRVIGWEQQTPRLRFMGRADGGCDLRGEKLHPLFVQQTLAKHTSAFAMLAPASAPGVPGYVLCTTDRHLPASTVETALKENPYYAHAVSVGQLLPVRKFLITDEFPSHKYLERCTQLGQRSSTVKATALHRAAGWEKWFQGNYQP